MAEAVELSGPAPLCIKNLKGQVQVGWTPTGLCQKHTLKHSWEAQNNEWTAIPTGAFWVCGSHGCLYLPRNWTGRCTWGGLICLPQFRKLTIRPVNWKVF